MLDFDTTYLATVTNLGVPESKPVRHIAMLPIWLGEGYWFYRAAFDHPSYRAYGRVVEDSEERVVMLDDSLQARYEFRVLTKALWAALDSSQEHQALVANFAGDPEVQGFFRMEWADDILEAQSEDVLRKAVLKDHEELKRAGLVPVISQESDSSEALDLLKEALGDS